jgi:hypothetical protein
MNYAKMTLHDLLVPPWVDLDPAATHQIDSGVDPEALPCAWNGHVHGRRAAIWCPRVRNLRQKSWRIIVEQGINLQR